MRLNRRLAPGVYIGVLGIIKKDDSYRVGGEGGEGEAGAVEYAVKMKRLPEESVLEEMLKADIVTPEMIKKIALVIAAFHENALTGDRISRFGSPRIIKKNTDENFSQTAAFIGGAIPERLFNNIKNYTGDFIRANEWLFKKRMTGGFIRDCHGDLHCGHISITDDIEIFDCIEFNERFRFSDLTADIAFLSMDLDFHNRNDLSRVLDSEYFSVTGDTEGRDLMDFYRCYRAYVRGKVDSFKYMEEEVTAEERRRAFIDARHHFYLAGLYAEDHEVGVGRFRPMMLVVRGLSGTGKTTVAKSLAKSLCMVHLSSDAVRKELAGIPPGERRPAGYKEGIYSDEFTDKTYRALIEKGVSCLSAGRSVVLDATFSRLKHILDVRSKVEGLGKKRAEFHVVECKAGDEEVRRRFLKRISEDAGAGAVSDGRWEIYEKQKKSFDAVPADFPRIEVDTAEPLEEVIRKIINRIFG